MDPSEDQYLKLHPDTMTTVRKMYDLEKREDMDRAIDALEDWLKKQHHFTKKDYSRDFLERSIINRKGSVERVKSSMENLCSFRALFPIFFDKVNATRDFDDDQDPVWVDAILPKLTKDHYRVYVSKIRKDGATSDIVMDMYKIGIWKTEYVKAHDYPCGFIAIYDYRNINILSLMSVIEVINTHRMINILIEGYGLRVKAIHAISSSKTIEALVKLIKPLLSPKIASRLHIHADIEMLYDYVPRDILPSEFGGAEESILTLSERFKNVLETKENVDYMREMSKAVSTEAYRMKEKLNNLDLGIAGTFRSLSVD